jgi:hypothetical protein
VRGMPVGSAVVAGVVGSVGRGRSGKGGCSTSLTNERILFQYDLKSPVAPCSRRRLSLWPQAATGGRRCALIADKLGHD